MKQLSILWKRMTRRKDMKKLSQTMETDLKRCLTIFDLTFIGIGSAVGSGIYIMTGVAAKELGGPAIVISYVLSAFLVYIVALCYTEFASRIPRGGSDYLYAYCSMGEFIGFLTGFWSITGYMMGTVAGARGWSSYLNYLVGGAISNFTTNKIAFWEDMAPLSEYPDFVGCAVVIVLVFIVSAGVQCSSKINAVISVLNVALLVFVSILGFVYADPSNWTSSETGGFMPYGFSGVVAGAFSCFWAFSGFESISTSVEEAKNPKHSIPWATGISLTIITTLYILLSSAVTLILPYTKIDKLAPLPSIFAEKNLYWAEILVSIGPIFGLTTTTLSGVYGSSRYLYSMALDGMFPTIFSKVNACSQVPVIAVFSLGPIMACATLLIDIETIIEFGVIFEIFSYIQICAAVIIVRYKNIKIDKAENHMLVYQSESDHCADVMISNSHVISNKPAENITKTGMVVREFALRNKYLNIIGRSLPRNWVIYQFLLSVSVELMISFVVQYGGDWLMEGVWWLWLIVIVLGITLILLTLSLYLFQQNTEGLKLKVPLVPVLPSIGIFVCVYILVVATSPPAWTGAISVTAIGILAYFGYSIRHSSEEGNVDEIIDQNIDDNIHVD